MFYSHTDSHAKLMQYSLLQHMQHVNWCCMLCYNLLLILLLSFFVELAFFSKVTPDWAWLPKQSLERVFTGRMTFLLSKWRCQRGCKSMDHCLVQAAATVQLSVSHLHLNVPFQHKYGYIRDDTQLSHVLQEYGCSNEPLLTWIQSTCYSSYYSTYTTNYTTYWHLIFVNNDWSDEMSAWLLGAYLFNQPGCHREARISVFRLFSK